MKIPKIVKVCGADYRIVFKKKIVSEGIECLGLCDVNKCVIYLQYKMEKQKRFEVFLHEIIHAIDESMLIGLGEKKVNNLTIELIRVIRDNKIKFS